MDLIKSMLIPNIQGVYSIVEAKAKTGFICYDINLSLLDIKAINEAGKLLPVKGVGKSGNIVHIRAIGKDDSFYTVFAISPEGQVNDVKGIKINECLLENKFSDMQATHFKPEKYGDTHRLFIGKKPDRKEADVSSYFA